jgi:hypothetical protein
MESLPKISNRGSILFGLLASFFMLVGKIIGSLVSLGESLWRREGGRRVMIYIKIEHHVKNKDNIKVYLSSLRRCLGTQ